MEPRTARQRERRISEDSTQRPNERAQSIAFDRLVTLLEADAGTVHRDASKGSGAELDTFSRLARLRAARAAYALATSGDMKRVASGAWVRRMPC